VVESDKSGFWQTEMLADRVVPQFEFMPPESRTALLASPWKGLAKLSTLIACFAVVCLSTGALSIAIAIIFLPSVQQLGSRPHGRFFWRIRGECRLASSLIGRIGLVTFQA